MQSGIHRSYKADGTVLTEADLFVSVQVEKVVKKYFPDSNFITEESKGIFSLKSPFTFVLDPIYGTDAYSQGLPSWAVSLGVLDQNRVPVAAVVYAPRFGVGVDELFLVRKMGMEVALNDEKIPKTDFDEDVKMIAMEVSSIKVLGYSSFKGNFRVFGSAVLHMVNPVAFMHFQASVHNSCYVWDVAGPHAILKGLGLDVEYYVGNIIHIFTNSVLSSSISWLLGLASSLWTQIWGLVFGEFKGASAKSYIYQFLSFGCYVIGAYVLIIG